MKIKIKQKKSVHDLGTNGKTKAQRQKVNGERLEREDVERSAPVYMVPDKELASEKLEESGASDFFKLQAGMNEFLMLPSTAAMGLDNGGLPWAEDEAHYCGGKEVMELFGLGERPDDLPLAHGCAKSAGRNCEWCNQQAKLYKRSNSLDKQFAKKLKANLQCIANVVDIRNMKKVKPFRFPRSIRDGLLAAIDAGIDFYNPENLLIIKVKMISKGSKPWEVEYKVFIKNDKARRKGPMRRVWIDGMSDLSTFITPIPEPEAIEEVLAILTAAAEASGEEVDFKSRGRAAAVDDFTDDDIPFG